MNVTTAPSIGIIGSGRVANAIGFLFHSKGITIKSVYSRNLDSGHKLAKRLQCDFVVSIEQSKADILILCVNDDEIFNVLQSISIDQKVLYTAGSISLESLGRNKCGVFYPLQTFTAHSHKMDNKFPMLIEANDPDLYEYMIQLCKKSDLHFEHCSSDRRKQYHLVAVLLNNFVNHMVHISQSEAGKRGLDWAILQPLLEKTCDSIIKYKALDNQTGPARRGDQSILNMHEDMLDEPNKELYKLLSNSIINTYHEL
ncbi:DUF2520 domain-containing protein [Crocinitomicaceae bacterium]|nr:DUF2520 domain-containing protein [Crocinitomicaceae bacterium]